MLFLRWFIPHRLPSLVSFAAISLCVASQRAIPKVSAYFDTDSVRKLLDTPSYVRILISRDLIALEGRFEFNRFPGLVDIMDKLQNV
jgi:hypothetical protein